jgi:glycosyltransferase involved in cell wall biosynthesis
MAYSNLGRDQYIQAGLSPDQVFVAPNATAPKPVGPVPERKPNFSNGKPTIIYVGRLQARKKIDTLINVCAKLPEKIKPNLWIVGDGQVMDELKSLAETRYPAIKRAISSGRLVCFTRHGRTGYSGSHVLRPSGYCR